MKYKHIIEPITNPNDESQKGKRDGKRDGIQNGKRDGKKGGIQNDGNQNPIAFHRFDSQIHQIEKDILLTDTYILLLILDMD